MSEMSRVTVESEKAVLLGPITHVIQAPVAFQLQLPS